MLGVRNNEKKMIIGNQIQKFGRLRQTAHSLRCLERSTPILHLGTLRNHPITCKDKGQEWIKINYDTGAAPTALLVELVEGLPLRKVVEFIVANGQGIPISAEPSFRQ